MAPIILNILLVTKQIQEIDEYIAAQELLRRERSKRSIRGNNDFVELISAII